MNLCGGITNISEQDLFLEIPTQDNFRLSPQRKLQQPSSSSAKHSLSRQNESISTSNGGALASSSVRRRHHSSFFPTDDVDVKDDDNNNNNNEVDFDRLGRQRHLGATNDNSRKSKTYHSRSLQFSHSPNNNNNNMTKPNTFTTGTNDSNNYHQHTTSSSNRERGLRSSNILMKKLESGFNVTWLNCGVEGGWSVNLATNSDKTCLRIRTRSVESREDRNDGSTSRNNTSVSPPADFKIKIRHIARVGSDKETTPDAGGGLSGTKTKYGIHHHMTSQFVIKMKLESGDYKKFKFVAESLAERDTVVLAIRSLLEKVRATLPGRSSRGEQPGLADDVRRSSTTRGNRSIEQFSNTFETSIAKKGVSDSQGHEKTRGSSVRSNKLLDRTVSRNPSDDEIRDQPVDYENDHSASNVASDHNDANRNNKKRDDSLALAEKVGESSTTMLTRRRSSRIVQGRRTRSSQRDNDDNVFSLDEMKDAFLYETIGCNPIGCQSEALAAVEDGELGQFAANNVSGPWCTDDVCSAGLHDLANSMKDIFDIDDPAGKKGRYASSERQRALAENYMSGFLGDNKAMGDFLSVKDMWNVNATKQSTIFELNGGQRLQNRARRADGKAANKARLLRQMTIDSSTNHSNMAFVQTVSSFDDVNRCGRWERNSKSAYLKRAGQLDSSNYFDRDVGQSPGSSTSEFLYYDSDPEDARERTLKRGPRRAMAERANKARSSHLRRQRPREALEILNSTRSMTGRKWKRFDEETVIDIVEATKNENLMLLWHPDSSIEKDGPMNHHAPTCVKMWVESGVYLVDGTFLLPKLTWLPRDENNLHSRELNASDENPGSLDLLDICRVRECDTIDRSVHPFAHTDRSFVIQTQDCIHLFEARSKQERGRIVNGLKLVIARLASLLMLRDLRAVDEFFGGNSFSVPGEAPVWARGERSESTTPSQTPP